MESKRCNRYFTVSPGKARHLLQSTFPCAPMPPKSLETEQVAREHLTRLLRSNAFAHVDRLKRFLHYVVEETIAGRAENLKEYSIGVEVFDRETSFDPRTDPIVRVQA